VLEEMAWQADLTVFSQDDPSFPEGMATRRPEEVVAVVPPDLVEHTVEKLRSTP